MSARIEREVRKMSECTHDCSSCGENCSERQSSPEDFRVKLSEGSSVKKVIGVVSGKGGVGKSMVTSLLACATMREGYKTAILDGDITGPSIPKAFGVHQNLVGNIDGLIVPGSTAMGIDMVSVNLLLANETDPVIWRGPVLGGVIKQFWGETLWQNIDYMFVDMPPGTGDVPLTIFQSLPLDGIIIVASPQELVGMIVEKAANMARMMNIPILGLVENMSYVECPDCGKKIYVFGESHIDEIASQYQVPVLAKIPMDPELAAACDAGKIEFTERDYMKDAVELLEKL
ncbi:antiporter inner membrane protein [Eubacteriaceae bacterium CHKCI004]|nr:antiporter inner membrane protein [Eubacteriaceae bacterium CHKCI004]